MAGAAPHDPLLGWAGLDADGRIVALGGRIATLPGALRIGASLADSLGDATELERFLAAGAAASPVDGHSGCCQRSLARWAVLPDGTLPGRLAVPDFELLLRRAYPTSGPVRIAAEFHRVGGVGAASIERVGVPVAPAPIDPALPLPADPWRLGSALHAATVVPSASRPVGLIRLALHPVPLPRLAAVDAPEPWLSEALARLAASAVQVGTEAVAARTGMRELTAWVREGSRCAALCAQWLAAMTAAPLVGSRCRLVVAPSAAWCVMPADGSVLGFLLDALDAVYDPADPRRPREPVAVGSRAREQDIEERREALTGTLVELVASGRARLATTTVVDAPTGLPSGLHLRAEFRSLFAVADLVDDLPDIIDDDAAADALNGWLAAAVRRAGLAAPRTLYLRIAPAQLRRLDSLAPVVAALREAGGGATPVLMLPEAAVHRDAYLAIDAAPEVAALGAWLGIDDYRGLLPPLQLAQAGIGLLRLHRSLVRELGEGAFAADRLADLLARSRAAGLAVLVAGLADPAAVSAATLAGALQLSGPVFGRPARLPPHALA